MMLQPRRHIPLTKLMPVSARNLLTPFSGRVKETIIKQKGNKALFTTKMHQFFFFFFYHIFTLKTTQYFFPNTQHIYITF
uniref:Uncharacterized protein n=1 Tax=Pyxicephalus adspersus TaxID=30357 RepID=A0AAV3AZJ0_PYXAD|nr:TPA: hypothetical protein GDO54_001033 [Pyxicephalus adspersus]